MKKLISFLLVPIFLTLVGCKNDEVIDSQQKDKLYLKDFYCENISNRAKTRESTDINSQVDENNVQFEIGSASISCEALVINIERDSFVDIVIYMSWNNKYVVYNEGNGDYRCSSTTEFDGEVWNTKINFTINIYEEHPQNGHVSVNDISFLHSGSQKTNAELNKSKNLSINYHEHHYTEEVGHDDYVYEERNHFHATRYYYSCKCGLSEKHRFAANVDHYFEKDELPIEHTFDKQIAETRYLAKNATCTEPAEYYFSCECGEHGNVTFKYGNPLGHNCYFYQDLNTETYFEDSSAIYKCTRCSHEEIRYIGKTAIQNGSYKNLGFGNVKVTVNQVCYYVNGVTSYHRFYNDERDNIVVIPEGIQAIESYTFKDFTNIEKVIIPDSVIEIHACAFSGCTNLKEVILPKTINAIGYGWFENCTSLANFSLSDNIVRIDGRAFFGCSSLSSINFENIVEIGLDAFNGCSSLTAVSLPSVTSFGLRCFANCMGLKSFVTQGEVPYGKIQILIGSNNIEELEYYCYGVCSRSRLLRSFFYVDECPDPTYITYKYGGMGSYISIPPSLKRVYYHTSEYSEDGMLTTYNGEDFSFQFIRID